MQSIIFVQALPYSLAKRALSKFGNTSVEGSDVHGSKKQQDLFEVQSQNVVERELVDKYLKILIPAHTW